MEAGTVSIASSLPPLCDAIGAVVGVHAQPQVPPTWEQDSIDLVGSDAIVPHTGGNIAGVQGVFTVRDRNTHRLFKGSAMRT